MSAKPMEESKDPFLQLFTALENALAIAGSDSKSETGLSLDKAELEFNLSWTKKMGGGVEIKSLGIDATAKGESLSAHRYKLKLRRSTEEFNLGPPEANELAESILALAKATQSVSLLSKNYSVDEAIVTIDIERTKEGQLKVFAGGGGGTGDIYKITLTFTKRTR